MPLTIIHTHLGFYDEHGLLCAQVEGEFNKASIDCEGKVVPGDTGALVQPHQYSIWGSGTEPDLEVVGSLTTLNSVHHVRELKEGLAIKLDWFHHLLFINTFLTELASVSSGTFTEKSVSEGLTDPTIFAWVKLAWRTSVPEAR